LYEKVHELVFIHTNLTFGGPSESPFERWNSFCCPLSVITRSGVSVTTWGYTIHFWRKLNNTLLQQEEIMP